ncbi:MAG: flavin-dependent oxidoreductase [Thalassobaculum sp.]|uniref:flavin-dependent oxidoreductase n=1 Tax=Thalassobaculum sp. TaxID=2022740 RepID=UPI0032EB46FC
MKAIVVGGGIGGLATALSLHAQGIEVEVFEQSRTIRELGVGINTLPHAIKELAALGLLDELDRIGIRTHELIYTNRFGQEIWRDLRGTDAGYEFPQFSIHRGKLQGVLHKAVLERIGGDKVHPGHQLVRFEDTGGRVTATFERREGHDDVTVTGSVLIGADGIHSTVRKAFYPDEGAPSWNGLMLWRGAVEGKPFLTGRSMIIAGGMSAKFVCYPIYNDPDTPGSTLLNWAVVARIGDGSTPPPRREDWSRLGDRAELMNHVDGVFTLDVVDPVAIINSTVDFYEYPMCDRDPVDRWSFGRVTLLGDAAHPMYPVGSNGASQAILDARCLAGLLAGGGAVEDALKAYEAQRLPMTAEIVRTNRKGGPEQVIDLVEERAPDGFGKLEDVATREELEAMVRGYASLARFSQSDVNKPGG